jgi:hypothetical protein
MVPTVLLEAREMEHRLELAKLEMTIVTLREALEQAGVDPPVKEGAELMQMWRDCRAVISTASDFVGRLGSAREMLQEEPWR